MFIISQGNSDVINILKIISKIVTVIIAMFILMLVITISIYKPAYKVELAGQQIGYIDNKAEFEALLDDFINQNNEEVAYVDMDTMPTYNFILLRREQEVDSEKTLELVTNTATVYDRVYVVYANDTEIATVKTNIEAEELMEKAVDTANNKKVSFSVKEANIVKPSFSNEADVLALVEKDFKAKKLTTTYVATTRTVISEEYIATNVVFSTPLRGTITSRYGYRGSEFHTGIDIANSYNSPIYAAADGKVIYSGTKGTYGHIVIIEHEDNMLTYYAHCNKLLVEVDDEVKLGQQIATIGMTGRTTGPHVHFEVRIGNKVVNPEGYIKNITK